MHTDIADGTESPEPSGSLEGLEADVAAVASALETVDQIVQGAASGEVPIGSAASQIDAVVSTERFGAATDS